MKAKEKQSIKRKIGYNIEEQEGVSVNIRDMEIDNSNLVTWLNMNIEGSHEGKNKHDG